MDALPLALAAGCLPRSIPAAFAAVFAVIGLAILPVTDSLAWMAGFRASYAVASLGCTIPPFLAVVVTAFRAGSALEGGVLFLACGCPE